MTPRKESAGRIDPYSELYPPVARELYKHGKNHAEVAEHFNVNRVTIYRWRKLHPEFADAVEAGIAEAPHYRIAQIQSETSAHAAVAESSGPFAEMVSQF